MYFPFSIITINTTGVLVMNFGDFRSQNLSKNCEKWNFRFFGQTSQKIDSTSYSQIKRVNFGIVR